MFDLNTVAYGTIDPRDPTRPVARCIVVSGKTIIILLADLGLPDRKPLAEDIDAAVGDACAQNNLPRGGHLHIVFRNASGMWEQALSCYEGAGTIFLPVAPQGREEEKVVVHSWKEHEILSGRPWFQDAPDETPGENVLTTEGTVQELLDRALQIIFPGPPWPFPLEYQYKLTSTLVGQGVLPMLDEVRNDWLETETAKTRISEVVAG
jgi:hypothetical protein